MTTPPVPDITETDPRVAQVLAMIRAKQAPVDTVNAPPSNVMLPPAVDPSAPPAPNLQMAPPQQLPNIQAPPPNVAPAPQAGPVKSFLQSLVSGLGNTAYAGTQGALQRLGIPTDYEKQQNAAHLQIAQQAANDNSQYRQALTDLTQGKSTQLDAGQVPFAIPQDEKYGAFSGMTLPTAAATPIMQRMEALQQQKDIAAGKVAGAKDIAAGKNATTIQGKEIQYGADSYLRHGFKSISGRDVEYDKGTGAVIKDYGPSNSVVSGVAVANARGAANARYRTFDTVDGDGNPVTISGLDALQGGAAHTPYAQAKGVKSDLVGIQQYDQILGRISQNLPVLNDNTQRVAIAHTLAEADKNPSMFQSIITSALQKNALTPAGAQLAADIMQGREFGGVARKYGGNMNGTEGLMNRIMANQASPLNSEQVNRDLIANDQAFTKKANVVVSGLSRHNAGNRGGPPNIAPAPTTAPQRPSGVPDGAHWNPQGNNGSGSWQM